ncbi:MAG: hypothetical protein HZB26_24110 [Candidatus Hydrogenedentes bacterium]|nr:hypothetical protein [Candidatus Hydrogenedentota bacterium]
MHLSIPIRFVMLMLVLLPLTACNHFSHNKAKAAPDDKGSQASVAVPSPEQQKSDAEEKLRATVRNHIEAAGADQAEAKNRLERRSPYYFKQYEVFPDGPDAFEVDIRKTESLTSPLEADVKMKSQRYSTRLHRDREEAANDSNFLRNTGTKTETYRFQNGKWIGPHVFYVAEKTEENVNGEWVAAKETLKRTIAAEEPRSESWFQRSFSWLTGR